ncbi:MAG: D-alanyl-D-alanine carboxypeptidase [Nitrospiraceae bacterium]|nr:D-alanyl-D-alanine carboxypeptidase [Nitrospiraceae bacterium]
MKDKIKIKKPKIKISEKIIIIIFVFAFLIFTFLFSTAYAQDISSKAALVMEASTGRILFAKNPNLKLLPASTTKLVTAMVTLDRKNMNDTVVISEKAAKIPLKYRDNEQKFKAGESVLIGTLLYAALLMSANDAAFALAEGVSGSEAGFVDLMNKKVSSIGAAHTKFINTTGLPGKGQQITAYDLAKIMRYSLKYPEIREILKTKKTEILMSEGRAVMLENTNMLLWSDEGALGGKTGYTKAARHCFVYAGERNGETIIVAILGAPNRNTLWHETEKLLAKGVDVLANNEQPMVYFTKADYMQGTKKTVYKNYSNKKIKTKKKYRDTGVDQKDENNYSGKGVKIKGTTISGNGKNECKG